jgi:hypothetical protein
MSKRQRIIFIIAVVVCTIAGTLFISRNKHLTMYEASASIYPMQMRCDGGSKATINPSYKYKRILASEEFNNSLPALPAGTRALRTWKFHESNDHQIHVSLYMKDSNEAVEMLTKMVELANEMYENCNSTQLENESSCHEAVVADYQKLVTETLQDSSCAAGMPHLLCCDITSSPQIVRVPSVGSIVFYAILNLLFSLIVCGATALIYKRSRNEAT